MYNVGGIFSPEAYANNVRCMYTNVPDLIVDCSKLI